MPLSRPIGCSRSYRRLVGGRREGKLGNIYRHYRNILFFKMMAGHQLITAQGYVQNWTNIHQVISVILVTCSHSTKVICYNIFKTFWNISAKFYFFTRWDIPFNIFHYFSIVSDLLSYIDQLVPPETCSCGKCSEERDNRKFKVYIAIESSLHIALNQ